MEDICSSLPPCQAGTSIVFGTGPLLADQQAAFGRTHVCSLVPHPTSSLVRNGNRAQHVLFSYDTVSLLQYVELLHYWKKVVQVPDASLPSLLAHS